MIQIPLRLLPSTMTVQEPADGLYGGTYGDDKEIANVRFDQARALKDTEYVLSDGASGVVFVDGENSTGAYEVPEGSRVSVDGGEWMEVIQTNRYCDYGGHIHHWELEVR